MMKSPFVRALTICAVLAVTSLFLANARRSELPVSRKSFDSFPMKIGDWRAVVDPPLEADILKILGVDDYLSRVYYGPNRLAVGLYMGFYASQRQGDTIHSPLNCLPGAGWEPISQDRLVIPGLATSEGIEVNRYVVQKGLERQMVLYWYQSHGRVVASEYTSRLLLIGDAVRLNRTDGSLVRVIIPIPHDADGSASEQLGVTFVRQLFPLLAEYLPA